MAVAAIDAVIADMMLMAERHRLVGSDFHVGDEGSGVDFVSRPYSSTE